MEQANINLNVKTELTEEKLIEFANSMIIFMGSKPRFNDLGCLIGIKWTELNSFKIGVQTIGEAVDDGVRTPPLYHFYFDKSVISSLYNLFYTILCLWDIFPGVGSCSGRVAISELQNGNKYLFDFPMDYTNSMLFTQRRKDLHDTFFYIAKMFMIRHEAYHILNGHTNYLFVNNIRKFQEGELNTLSQIDSQTFEMDADCNAFGNLLLTLLGSKNQTNIPSYLNTDEKIINSLIFVVCALFICLPFDRINDPNELINSSHPPAVVRLEMCLQTGIATLEKYKPELVSHFNEAVKKNVTECIFPLLKSGLVPYQSTLSDFLKLNQNEVKEHRDKIMKNWNKWIPILKPLAFVDLAPAH